MERRVPLAIFLCFLTVLVWAYLNPPPEPEPVEPGAEGRAPEQLAADGLGETPAAGEQAAGAAPGTLAGSAQDLPVEGQLAASERLEQTLEFGTFGEPGSFRARFDNLGGRLLELRSGDYYRAAELTDEERRDPENWVVLLDSLPLAGGRFSGSFGLAPGVANRVLPPAAFDTALWEAEVVAGEGDVPQGMRFRYGPGNGLIYEKTITAVPGSNELELRLAILNTGAEPAEQRAAGFRLRVAAPIGVEYRDRFYMQPTAIAVGEKDNGDFKTDKQKRKNSWREAGGLLEVPAPVATVGAHSKYFAVLGRGADAAAEQTMVGAAFEHLGPALRPVPQEQALDASAEVTRDDTSIAADALLELELPAPGERAEWRYRIYAGPKDHAEFLDLSPAHGAVMESDLSFFSGIGKFLTKVLIFLEGLCGNWGVAIILLTVLIRAVLFPINRRSQTAMARYQVKMKRVQPKLEAVKKKFENDPAGLRQAQGKLMQEEGVFPPLGGCLPIFLQLPIFFGLFAALRTSFELRQAPFFGYITDLSRPDRLMYLGDGMPFESLKWLNILPLLMVVLWIWQQRTMPKPSDEQAAQVQKIMLFMPLVMGVFLYNYAAGLSLYMITQSALGIFEQKVIKKLWPVDDSEPEGPQKSGCGCAPLAKRMQDMAEQQQKNRERLLAAQRQNSKGQKGSKKRR